MIVVMGIDPGVANTGFGVVRVAGAGTSAIDAGVIEVSSKLRAEERLARIFDGLTELIGWHEPDSLALEDLYFGRNARSAMGVGQARGVAMLAAARKGIECFDYTPQAVKMSVCGSGSADKAQVQHMVASLLGLPAPPAPDHAADALAVALCHAAHARTLKARRRHAVSPAATRTEVRAG